MFRCHSFNIFGVKEWGGALPPQPAVLDARLNMVQNLHVIYFVNSFSQSSTESSTNRSGFQGFSHFVRFHMKINKN